VDQSAKTPSDAFALKSTIFLEVVSQLSRSSSMELGGDSCPQLGANLKPTLQLIERILFEAGPSFLHDPDPGADTTSPEHLELLERLLITSLKFLPFPDRREHVVRLVLRYLQVVLARPTYVTLCPVILGAASQVFGLMLGDPTPGNLRVVQIAIAFLKSAAAALYDTEFDSALDIERVVQSLVHVWGTVVFTDLAQHTNPPKNEDSDRASLLVEDDVAEYVAGDETLPAVLGDEQLHERSEEAFGRLRMKFLRVLEVRGEKLTRMLSEYSAKVAETLAAKQMSDVKAQNEFSRRLADITLPTDGTIPATVQAVGQRNAYLMARAVHALKRFRDAFEYGARRNDADLFWKLDPTENPMRMRYLLRRNPNGDNHPNAASRATDSSATARAADAAALPAVIAAGASEENEPAPVTEPEEKLAAQWTSEAAEEDEEPVGFNIDRAGDATDDTVVPAAADHALLIVSCTLISLTRKVDGEFTIGSESLRFVGKQDHLAPGDTTMSSMHEPSTIDTNDPEEPVAAATSFKPRQHFWLLRDIRQVLPRRYLLRECGMEIFTKSYRCGECHHGMRQTTDQ